MTTLKKHYRTMMWLLFGMPKNMHILWEIEK